MINNHMPLIATVNVEGASTEPFSISLPNSLDTETQGTENAQQTPEVELEQSVQTPTNVITPESNKSNGIFSSISLVIIMLVALSLIAIILKQSKRSAGFSATMTSSSDDTYWGKNKGRSKEGALERYTKILGAVFLIGCLVINIFII